MNTRNDPNLKMRLHQSSPALLHVQAVWMNLAVQSPFINPAAFISLTPPFRPVHPSYRALSERVEFTVRRHKFNKHSPFNPALLPLPFFLIDVTPPFSMFTLLL